MKKLLSISILIVLLIALTACKSGEKMKTTKIKMETTMGTMEFEIFDNLVPVTAENFKKLASEGFYDGTRFHRVIEGFMIQGGDPKSKDLELESEWGTGGPGYKIKDEFSPSLKHNVSGLLSMANSGPNTGGSQFFITLVPTPHLDGKHAVFGKLISGEEVLERIGITKTDENDRPIDEVVIEKVVVG